MSWGLRGTPSFVLWFQKRTTGSAWAASFPRTNAGVGWVCEPLSPGPALTPSTCLIESQKGAWAGERIQSWNAGLPAGALV